MVLDAGELKRRYQEKWARGNARERFVLAALNAFLPPGFTAELTGRGAGSEEYIERSFEGREEAFDITIYHGDAAVAYVDVTGVAGRGDMQRHRCNGLCVGVWKLEKASRLGLLDRAWIAFVVDEDLSIRFQSLRWLRQALEAPYTRVCRLYEDERLTYCTDTHYWKRFKAFRNWLVHTAVYQALAARG